MSIKERREEDKEEEVPCEPAYDIQFDDSDEEEESGSSDDDDDVEDGRRAAPPEASRQPQRKAVPVPQQQQMRQSQQRSNPQQQQIQSQQQQKGGPPQKQRQSQQQQRPGGPEQQQRRGSPPPGARPPPRGEKNENFQDVDTTGRSGNISKKEMILVAVVLLAIIGGVVTAVVLLTGGDSESAPPPPTPPPTEAPTIRPAISPDLQLPVILDVIKNNDDTNAVLSPLLPDDLAFYTSDKIGDVNQPPSVQAMSWILNEDPRDPGPNDPWLVFRYALASMYFALAGEGWSNQNNWLSEDHACEWYGVICDRFSKNVMEVDLTNNNLIGIIPPEMALLTDLRSIVLQRNEITGTIPSEMFGNLPVLSILFLNDNNFQGDLVELEPLRDNGILSTLFIQQNNITGRWPRDFCPRTGQPPVFFGFGLDCTDSTRCLCCQDYNCY